MFFHRLPISDLCQGFRGFEQPEETHVRPLEGEHELRDKRGGKEHGAAQRNGTECLDNRHNPTY